MSVLSQRDRDFWHENGYVVVRDAVPKENLDAMVDAIWAFLDMDPRNPEDWYRYKPYTRGNPRSMISASGMVEIYQHQALWDNRQYPKVHRAFSEIWGTEKLWVSLDRANMKPPSRADKPDWQNEGMIHWDTDTSVPNVPFGVQGVLYLTDTSADQGGFQCVEWMPAPHAEQGQHGYLGVVHSRPDAGQHLQIRNPCSNRRGVCQERPIRLLDGTPPAHGVCRVRAR